MSSTTMDHASTAPAIDQTGFFGHPRGLATLFFTEMWERFSYYGMRALLMLFMTAQISSGGMALKVETAGAIYGLYTSLVYLLGLPGGWIADRYLGQRRAVLWGGIAIAIGQLTLAIPDQRTFFAGLGIIIIGTGLLKPNVSAIVGQIYPEGDERRDAGFSIFYMGINIGAFVAPFVCGYLGEQVNWHIGFGIAGIGMTVGLIQYVLGARHLGDAGLHPVPAANEAEAKTRRRQLWAGIALVLVATTVIAVLQLLGLVSLDIIGIANAFGVVLLVLTVVFFAWLLLGDWQPVERNRLIAIMLLFLAASIFWGAYEQAGSSFNLFARDFTDRVVLGYELPASWFQLVPALFVIMQAPLFAWLWVRLGKRQPSSPFKFALGLIFVGLGFAVMIVAASLSANGAKVGPQWLLVVYFLHVVGEMCLSPVGLSTVTKLAPARVTSLMMGVWFLASSVGNYLGGRAAGYYDKIPVWQLFTIVTLISIGCGLFLLLLVKPIRRLMGGVH